MIKPVAATLGLLLSASAAVAQTIYPIDRAEILSGARFDFKVEFPDKVDPAKLKVTVNGQDHAAAFGQAGTFVEREDGNEQSAQQLSDVVLTAPGPVVIEAGDGARSRKVTWTVYDTPPRKAKNVILFIGDGMSPSHRTAARLLSKGIAEGRSLGKLAIDDMPHMAMVATAGSDSIVTDSANAASAYATGHKSAVNAMGVYADRTRDPFDDPKVETIASLRRWWPILAAAPSTTGLSSSISQPSPMCCLAAAAPISCQRLRLESARTMSIISPASGRLAIRLLPRPAN